MKLLITALVMTTLISPCIYAADYRSDYIGQEQRKIKSLSDEDLAAIQNGKGWGLAKAAELNGYPGPRHVLDMAEELGITDEQRSEMERLFGEMKAQAIAEGERYLIAERRLEEAFRNKTIDQTTLKTLIDSSADALAELRYEHLYTHLKAIRLLSDHQIASYNRLRGYAGDGDQHHGH